MIACLIDDDELFVFGMKKMLEITKVTETIMEFSNGQDAISYLQQATGETVIPDVIFLDINMPVMDGWEFIRLFDQLQTRLGKKIKVYMISSSIAPEDISRARNIKAISDYLIKPLSIQKIKELFATHLN